MLYKVVYEQDIVKFSKNRRTSYTTAWNRLESLHNTEISALSLPFLQDFLDELELTHYAIKDIKALLQKLFNYAEQCNYINKNYIKFIRLPDAKETKERVIFSDSDIEKLWNAWNVNGEYAEIAGYILIMIHTGIRTGELMKIELENISLSENIIRDRKSVV